MVEKPPAWEAGLSGGQGRFLGRGGPQQLRPGGVLFGWAFFKTGLYRAFWGEFFKVFSRSFCSQDGFLTLRDGELAPSEPCMRALIVVPFDPFIVGRKVPLFVPLQCSLSI